MSTQTMKMHATFGIADAGAKLVALAGVGLIGYGVMFLVQNFTQFIELGLTPQQVGINAQQLLATNPRLYDYISHLQVALSGFIIALGVAVIWMAWAGIRRGEKWALWASFVAPVVAVGIALPLHFPFGFATLGHLGLIYLDAAILLIGTIVAYREMASS